jgi:hypothetical protein
MEFRVNVFGDRNGRFRGLEVPYDLSRGEDVHAGRIGFRGRPIGFGQQGDEVVLEGFVRLVP